MQNDNKAQKTSSNVAGSLHESAGNSQDSASRTMENEGSPPLPDQKSNSDLEKEVNLALSRFADLNISNLKIHCLSGVAEISGTVKTHSALQRASSIVKNTKGVKGVAMNLKIQSSGAPDEKGGLFGSKSSNTIAPKGIPISLKNIKRVNT